MAHALFTNSAKYVEAALALLHAMLFNGEAVPERALVFNPTSVTWAELLDALVTTPQPLVATVAETVRSSTSNQPRCAPQRCHSAVPSPCFVRLL